MRIIVSPAKKMNVVDSGVDWLDLPPFVEQAEELARAVRARSYDEAKDLWKCSDALAELNFERYRTMDLRDAGRLSPAALAYEGVQYQHLAPSVMSERELAWLQEHLRILSGLYGVLRPLDGVVPYRLEMQAKLAVGGARDLYAYWGSRIFDALRAESGTIVNLASVEYAKAVAPFARKDASARFVTCLFGEVDESGKLRQRATAAKAARGSMVRWCAERGIEHVEDLVAFDALGYRFVPSLSSPDTLVFATNA